MIALLRRLFRRKPRKAGFSLEEWQRLTMEPIEQRARMLSRVFTGNDANWPMWVGQATAELELIRCS